MTIPRDILEAFKKWKTSTDRKPILIKGARQIGKTWVMEEFGRQCYEYYVKFDFDEQQELASVFQTTKDPHRVIKELELFCDVPLLPEKTLIIFDEIQECEEARVSGRFRLVRKVQMYEDKKNRFAQAKNQPEQNLSVRMTMV